MADDASAPGAAGHEEGSAPLSASKVSFLLVPLIRTEQGQNGVKHGDYARYRRHCKNKLQSLYKALKFQHGRTKYVKRKVDAALASSDVRYLHIPLFNAERAWAYAKMLKKEIEEYMDLKKRRQLVSRLRKASLWANELARLAAQTCDARGCLETQAYAALIAGTAVAEREKEWTKALALLTRARHLLEALSRTAAGSSETQALYLSMVEELEPPIRYCSYQITRQGAAAPQEPQLLQAAEQEEGFLSSSEVSSYLEVLRAEGAGGGGAAAAGAAGEGAAAGGAVTLEWQGQSIPVRNDRLRAAVQQAQRVEGEVSSLMEVDEGAAAPAGPSSSSSSSSRASLYERLIKALHEARNVAKLAVRASTAPEGDAGHQELVAAEAALGGLILQAQVDLAELQVADAEARFAFTLDRVTGGGKKNKDAGGKRQDGCRPEEVVRQLDALIRALVELGDAGARGGGRAGEQLYDQTTAKVACARASRAFYTAHQLLLAGLSSSSGSSAAAADASATRCLEAYAMFQRAGERAEAARQEALSSLAHTDLPARVAALAKACSTFQLVSQAEYTAQVAQQREAAELGVGSLGLSEGPAASGGSASAAAGAGSNRWLTDALDSWEAFAGAGKPPRVHQLPFSMQAIPCRPIMLDTAASHLAYPSLEHRLKKEVKKSVLSSLGLGGWGWGAKK